MPRAVAHSREEGQGMPRAVAHSREEGRGVPRAVAQQSEHCVSTACPAPLLGA